MRRKVRLHNKGLRSSDPLSLHKPFRCPLIFRIPISLRYDQHSDQPAAMGKPKKAHSSGKRPRNSSGQFASKRRCHSGPGASSNLSLVPYIGGPVEEDVKPDINELDRQTRSVTRAAGSSKKPCHESSRTRRSKRMQVRLNKICVDLHSIQ